MKSFEKLFCNKINILITEIIIFQYYRYKYNEERCVKKSLKNLDFNTKIYKDIEFVIKTLGEILIIFIVVIIYLDKNNEFFIIIVNLSYIEFLYNLVKGK